MKTEIIEIFKEISKIPHCSENNLKLRDFIEQFCLKQGCFVEIDSAGNILSRKGMPQICLQSHYDMVCVGDAPKINIYEEDGFLKAKNSSLGADNGIGVALMLYFAKTNNNIELLFTNDEEIGMIGANNINVKVKSNNILNLDTEEEGAVCIGCAGGIDVDITKNYTQKSIKEDMKLYRLSIEDLPGGHSGVDIDKNIPNAIKELGYYLSLFYPKIVSLNGGEALNSIPKNIVAVVGVEKDFNFPKSDLVKIEKIKNDDYKNYFEDSEKIIDMICGFANGVREYDKKLGIPSVSVNLAKIRTINDLLILNIFPRANENLMLKKIKIEIASYFKNLFCDIKFSHEYPAWKPVEGDFAKNVLSIYKSQKPKASFYAVHAGLECGILLNKLGENKEFVSIGPNIYFPHSVREKCEINSIETMFEIVKQILNQ